MTAKSSEERAPSTGEPAVAADAPPTVPAHVEHERAHHSLLPLALGALGVVYGDIGTSPLYAMKECLTGEHGAIPSHENVLGVLSLVFWALILTVTVKYVILILRAHNRGEGGVLALVASARFTK